MKNGYHINNLYPGHVLILENYQNRKLWNRQEKGTCFLDQWCVCVRMNKMINSLSVIVKHETFSEFILVRKFEHVRKFFVAKKI